MIHINDVIYPGNLRADQFFCHQILFFFFLALICRMTYQTFMEYLMLNLMQVICTQLYSFKYSDLIQIIYIQGYSIKKLLLFKWSLTKKNSSCGFFCSGRRLKKKKINMRASVIPIVRLVHLERSQESFRRNWRNYESVEESKPTRLEHCWNRPEYWEESWRPEETCCHSDSSEKRLPTNVRVKNSVGVK